MYHNQNFFLLLAFISLQSSSIFASLHGNRLLFPVDYSQITVQQNQNFQPDFSKVSYFKKKLKLNEQQKLYHHIYRLIQSDRFIDMIDASLASNFHDFNNLLDSDIDDYLQCVNGKSDVEFIDYLAQEYPLYKKSLPIDNQQITVNFKPEIVTQDTVFDYPHYQLGFDLAGLNFQNFMSKRLIGKNLHGCMQDSQGNQKTLLDNALELAEKIIIIAHKTRFQAILLDMIDRNIPDDDIIDPSFNYIREYHHILNLDAYLYDWPVFEDGCRLRGFSFKEVFRQESAYYFLMLLCKDRVRINSTAEFIFDEKGNIRNEFKNAIQDVQTVRLLDNAIEDVFIEAIKDDVRGNLCFRKYRSLDFAYLLKYKDVSFIKKALKLWLAKKQEAIIIEAIKSDQVRIFKDIIELGNFDIHQVYYYDYEYRNMFQCAVDLDKNNIVTYLIQNTEQKDLLQLLRTAIKYRLYKSIQGSPFKAIKILLDAGVDIDFVYEDGNKVMDYIRDFEEFGSNPIKTLLTQASQRKALQDIEHVWTTQEKEFQKRLQQGFDLLGLNYHDFFHEQLAGRHLDESVGDQGQIVLDDIFDQAEKFYNLERMKNVAEMMVLEGH